MATSAPPPLHLLTPKPEPPDPVFDLSTNSTPNQNPDPGYLLAPNKCSTSSDKIEDPIISDYLRLTQLYSSIVSPGGKDQNALAVVSDHQSEPKKKKFRGNGLVRVNSLSPLDHLQQRLVVRQARITYESLRCFFVLENMTNTDQVSKNPSVIKPRNRADLKASVKMRMSGLYVHKDPDQRIVGPVPGVNIGDVFFYRAELMVLGVHNQIQGGIGYVPARLVPEGEPIATSIVASGGYQDDLEVFYPFIIYLPFKVSDMWGNMKVFQQGVVGCSLS